MSNIRIPQLIWQSACMNCCCLLIDRVFNSLPCNTFLLIFFLKLRNLYITFKLNEKQKECIKKLKNLYITFKLNEKQKECIVHMVKCLMSYSPCPMVVCLTLLHSGNFLFFFSLKCFHFYFCLSNAERSSFILSHHPTTILCFIFKT